LGKARRYGLHTDSSHRFERGVDPALQVKAIERATGLLLNIVGGEPGPIIDHSNEDLIPKRSAIRLRSSQIARVLGVAPDAHEVERMLQALGCDVTARIDGWELTPPSFRFDLTIEADLIEEIGRIYGYDSIPSTVQAFRPVVRRQTEAKVSTTRLKQLLVDRGYQEAITFSFVDLEGEQLLNPDQSPMALANPLSNELSVMRSSLWPGLIKAAQHNLNRQQTQIRLFETGLRFLVEETDLKQIPALAGVVTGTVLPEQWGVSSVDVDFFDIKGDVEALFELVGLTPQVVFEAAEHPALHPGQSAKVFHNGTLLGSVGALHPEIQNQLGMEQCLFLFELDLNVLTKGNLPSFQPISRYPAIRRDIAIVVDETVTAAQVHRSIAAEHVSQAQTIHLFDVYRGKRVATGRKSIALGLILQDLSRTLSDTDVDEIVYRIVARLQRELGASLRE
jgi:phenylalanyl-tRNA synthetase beta chain